MHHSVVIIRVKGLSFAVDGRRAGILKILQELPVDHLHALRILRGFRVLRDRGKRALKIVYDGKQLLQNGFCAHIEHGALFLFRALPEIVEFRKIPFQPVLKLLDLLILRIFLRGFFSGLFLRFRFLRGLLLRLRLFRGFLRGLFRFLRFVLLRFRGLLRSLFRFLRHAVDHIVRFIFVKFFHVLIHRPEFCSSDHSILRIPSEILVQLVHQGPER